MTCKTLPARLMGDSKKNTQKSKSKPNLKSKDKPKPNSMIKPDPNPNINPITNMKLNLYQKKKSQKNYLNMF